MDPTDATGNTVYVGGAFGGVWRSTNAATGNPANVSWTPLTDQQAALAVGAISIKPDGSVLLVGTGEANNALGNYYGLGFMRSIDNGANWSLISTANAGGLSLAGLGVSNMAWGTTTGLTNTVVAALGFTAEGIDEGNFTGASKRGVYASTDGGSTWTYEVPTDGTVSSNATDIVFNAKANGGAGAYFAAIRWHGVYTSTNGTTWTRMATQPGSLLTLSNCPSGSNATNTCPMYRGQFAMVPGRNEMYFWFVDPGDGDQGIFRSTNGGGSWTPISETGIAACGDGFGCGTQQAFYNLEIAAVPDGTATDLYAGAVNLFKCKLASGATTCSTLDANQANKWINLTHVYGCSPTANIAHVHPDEHGLDFRVISGKAVMYFGNDGGMYRALDGFTGLNSGTCTSPNTSAGIGFENLNNTTLGSLSQFVSFSIHPTDQNTILGGTQDNGSPATTTATSSSAWQTASRGDGGYNEINPSNPAQWFASHTFVDVEVCNIAPGCTPPDFENHLVVEGGDSKIGGDDGAFYTPYILDPQNSGELLLGTCRVWRGSTAGSGFAALSNTFDGSVTCPGQGGQVDLVRGLAAGGPTSGGFSNVVYATTEGSGPNGGFVAGEVWATTNAAGGPAQFTNRTFNGPSGSINPNNYVISSVALDKSDANGTTAYVGIMGFVGSGNGSANTHIWKTTNAGQSWTPFGNTTNGLPDAPVNALLVDSGTVYAGTDVGVFQSPTSGATWTEVGTASPLPNVAVTAIRLFNFGGTKKLRVSTYGRGIWEFALAVAPDFTNVISDSPQTVFPTQNATFHGTLAVQGGYNNAINLSCTGTPPSTCTLNPTQVPAPGSGTYTVTAGGAVGDYNFNAHATDNAITHDAPVTLHVVDFGLTDPSPPTVTAQQGGTSNSTSFQVTAAGSFSGTVALTCTGTVITAGATCNFSPSANVNPTAANPVNASVTVNVPAGVAVNNYTVTINANTVGAPAAKTKNFTLQVIAPPDFTWVINGPSAKTVLAGQSATYSLTATPVGSGTFTSDVTISCGNTNPALTTCGFDKQIHAGDPATTVTLTITTTGPNQGTVSPRRADNRGPWLPLTLPLAGVLIMGMAGRRVSRYSARAGLCVSLLLLGLLIACGGGGSSGPPPPSPISVTVAPGVPASLFPNQNGWPSQTAQFTATVNNTSNKAVTWAVTGAPANGTIDANGLYTAPTLAPGLPATVNITATSHADPTKSGSRSETLSVPTALGTYTVTVTATEGAVSHSPNPPVSLTVN